MEIKKQQHKHLISSPKQKNTTSKLKEKGSNDHHRVRHRQPKQLFLIGCQNRMILFDRWFCSNHFFLWFFCKNKRTCGARYTAITIDNKQTNKQIPKVSRYSTQSIHYYWLLFITYAHVHQTKRQCVSSKSTIIHNNIIMYYVIKQWKF